MEKRINTKLLYWTAGLLLATGFSVYLVHLYQGHRNADILLKRAHEAVAKNEADKAIDYYDRYLKFRPEDWKSRTEFGLYLSKHGTSYGEREEAISTLDKVLRHEPQNKEVRHRLALNYLEQGRFHDGIAHLLELERQGGSPRGEIEHKLGWAYDAQGDFEKARHWFEFAASRNPQKIDSFILLAQVLEKLGEADKVEPILDTLRDENPASHRPPLVRSRFFQKRGDDAQAEKELRRAQVLAPTDPDVLLAVADWDLEKGLLDAGRKTLQNGIDAHPKNAALVKALALVELRADRRAEAVLVLEKGLQKNPRAWDLQVLLTDLLVDDKKLDVAEQKIVELRKTGCPSALSDYLQARVNVEKGQWSESVTLLERVRSDLGSFADWGGRVNTLLGICYEQTGDIDQQRTAFQRAVHHEPQWTVARYGLGVALLASGRVEDALTELEAVSRNPDAPKSIHLVLARSLILKNLRQPEDRRSWRLVGDQLTKAEQAAPDSFEIPLLRAETLAAQRNFDRAEEVLEKAQARFPDKPVFPCARADLAMRQKLYAEAEKLLAEAQAKLGDSIDVRLAKLRLASLRNDRDTRDELLDVGKNIEALDAEARTRLLRELAEVWHRRAQYSLAEELWKRIATEQPRDLRSRLLLFEQALQSASFDAAKKYLNEMRHIEGNQGLLTRYAAAALMVAEARGERRRLESARQEINELLREKHQHDWSRLPLLLARIDEMEGKYDKAIEDYTRAFDLGERQTRVVARLLQLLLEHRLYTRANEVMLKYEEATPLTGELAKIGAEVALALTHYERALNLAKRAAPADSRDYRDLVWLGRMTAAAKKPDQAEPIFRLAVERAGHVPDAWVAWVEQLAIAGQHAEADKVLASIKSKMPADRLAGTLARCYEALGKFDEAEAQFLKAIDDRPSDFVLLMQLADFYRRADQAPKADAILRRVAEGTSAPLEVVSRARRWLAISKARSGNPIDYAAAIDLIQANVKQRGANHADSRSLALVQGTHPELRAKAIEAFEEAHQHQPASLDEMLLLAQLYEQAEEFGKARTTYFELMLQHPDNAQLLAHNVKSLMQSGSVADAEKFLVPLERREPSSVRVRELKAALDQRKQAPG